ncbi:hypothetical protein BHM03_00051021 [Ensete ventricosum]|nr:hypothetical protein BHM03_00051021 [Ensete ventricosum]
MRLGTRKERIGSSPRVSEVCQDDVREFARRRPRLTGRLSGIAEKLVGSYDGLVMNPNILYDDLIYVGNLYFAVRRRVNQPRLAPMQGRPPTAKPRPRPPVRGRPAAARASPQGRPAPLTGATARRGGSRPRAHLLATRRPQRDLYL